MMYRKRLRLTILIGLLTGLLATGLAADDEQPADVTVAAGDPAASDPAAGDAAAADAAAADAAAADAAAGEPETDDPTALPQITESDESPEGATATEPRSARPATRRRTVTSRNFRPSEDITADNSVAYPVDI